MKKISFLIIILSFSMVTGMSQENTDQTKQTRWKNFIHLEAGYIFPEGKINENLAIRQNVNYYNTGQSSSDGHVFSEISGLTLGLRYEFFFQRIKTGVSTGLRYTGLNAEITGHSSVRSDFFYLRYSMDGSGTRFARVKSLTENRCLLSIPLEVRPVIFKYPNMSFFVKAGIEYSIVNLGKKTAITFHNPEMDIHEKAIVRGITRPVNRNYSLFYSSVGMSLGKETKTNFMFEVFLPSLFLTRDNFSMIDTDYIEGFKLSAVFPVNRDKLTK